MKVAIVVGEKLGHPEGLRFFQNEDAAVMAGEDPKQLVTVGGYLCKWPEAAGPVPSTKTLEQWQAEYDARPAPASKAEQLVDQVLADPAALSKLKGAVIEP